MPERQSEDQKSKIRGSLTRWDQPTVAMILLLSLAISIGYGIYKRAEHGRYLEIDRAAPVEIPYLVDVNGADWPELAQLPGIGETLAKRIVDSRKTNGPYLDRTEIQRVQGIGPRTIEKLMPYLVPIPETKNIAGTSVKENAS